MCGLKSEVFFFPSGVLKLQLLLIFSSMTDTLSVSSERQRSNSYTPPSTSPTALTQVQLLHVEQEPMEISSQQDLERKLAGLRNEVQVQIMFYVIVLYYIWIKSCHSSVIFFFCVLFGL